MARNNKKTGKVTDPFDRVPSVKKTPDNLIPKNGDEVIQQMLIKNGKRFEDDPKEAERSRLANPKLYPARNLYVYEVSRI